MNPRALEPLARYRSFHLDPVNLRLHLVGVPAIVWSLLVLLALLPVAAGVTAAHALTAVVALWYLWLAPGVLGGLAAGAMLALLLLAVPVAARPGGGLVALAVFVAGWVVQFVGHARYERAKPAFLTDLRQLFVAPIFVVAELAFLGGWNPAFDAALRDRAVALRAAADPGRATPRG
jgi:uncharacterized membrane protein YGL010W